MKLDLSFEQNQQNINVPFSESGGQFNANFGETSVLHDGQNGATFTPFVSSDGIISWTNDRELPNPAPVNIKGEKGDKGEQGERGMQGIQGIQGERGTKGDKGDKGDRGEQGIQGVQGIKGETGAQGQRGADGTPATHRWSGTTLYITSASGTSSANLKGDKGDTGANGKNGTNGADGKNGIDGKTAYEYAKDGGYTGTEAEFAEKLATEYQAKTDETLKTTDKTVVGAINEVAEQVNKISDSNGIVGTWVFNDELTPAELHIDIKLESDGVQYDHINFDDMCLDYTRSSDGYTELAYDGSWYMGQIITITEEPTDTEFIAWLKANATKQVIEYQTRTDDALETASKEVVGAINEVNKKTVDKISYVSESYDEVDVGPADGIYIWGVTELLDDEDNVIHSHGTANILPLVAGDNVTFEVDNSRDLPVVKINASGGAEIVTTTGTGSAYVATISGITKLTKGLEITIIPHTASTTTAPTLNVNGLGAKAIRRQLSSQSSAGNYNGYLTYWISANYPIRLMYSGTNWVAVDYTKPSAIDLDGIVPTANGGVVWSDLMPLLIQSGHTMEKIDGAGGSHSINGYSPDIYNAELYDSYDIYSFLEYDMTQSEAGGYDITIYNSTNLKCEVLVEILAFDNEDNVIGEHNELTTLYGGDDMSWSLEINGAYQDSYIKGVRFYV